MEFDVWVWLESQKQHLAIVAGILTALAVVWKYLGKRMINCVRSILFMFNARAATMVIDHKLDDIMSQLIPNGGTSIKDSLNRIEDKQEYFGGMLKAQANTSDKATFETDTEGQCIWINRAHSRMTGFQSSEVMGEGWINVIAPECRGRAMRKWKLAVESGREFDEDIWYIKTDRVTRYLVNVHAYTIPGREGKTKGYLGEVTRKEGVPEQQEPVTREQRAKHMDQ